MHYPCCATRRRQRDILAVVGGAFASESSRRSAEAAGVIINHTTGTSGPNYSGALVALRETRPEMAACTAGSLNYASSVEGLNHLGVAASE